MAVNQVNPPFPTFNDQDGYPLNGGYLYIGQPGFEAQSTPKASFFDVAMTIPTGSASGAAVRINGGYAVYNGAPALIYASGPCSLTVKDQNDVLIFSTLTYDPRAALGIEESANFEGNTFADLMAVTANQIAVGAFARIKNIDATYQRAADAATNQNLTNTAGLKFYILGIVSPEACGTIGSGANDDAALSVFWSAVLAGSPGRASGAYRVSSNFSGTATQSVKVDAKAAKFTCVSPGHIDEMLFLEMNNNSLLSSDFGTWDADTKATKCVQIRNSATSVPATGRPDLNLRGVFLNPKLTTGATAVTASGIFIAGAFNAIDLTPKVQNVTRDAGTGTAGSVGCQAVVYTSLSAPLRNARSVVIRNPDIKNVTTLDALGSAACVDCDGVVIFQSAESDQECVVLDGVFVNCQGRDTKIAAPNAQVIRPTSHRSISGITGGSVHHAMLYGSGEVSNANVTLTGPANLYGTRIIDFYTAIASPDGWPLKRVSGLTVNDKSTGVETIIAIVGVSIANALAGATGRHTASISDVVLLGKSAQGLVESNNFGNSTGSGLLSIIGFQGQLTQAVVTCDSQLPNISGSLKDVINFAAEVPVIKRVIGGSLGTGWGKFADAGNVSGVARNFGLTGAAHIPGVSALSGLNALNNIAVFSGFMTLYANAATPDATLLQFDVGEPQGGAIFAIKAANIWGLFKTDANDAASTTISATAGLFDVGNAGTEPVTAGRLRIWKTNSGKTINIKNALGTTTNLSIHALI
jgi:hypothetical protein